MHKALHFYRYPCCLPCASMPKKGLKRHDTSFEKARSIMYHIAKVSPLSVCSSLCLSVLLSVHLSAEPSRYLFSTFSQIYLSKNNVPAKQKS